MSSKNRDRAGAVRVPTNKQTNKTTLSSYVGKVRVSANGRASGLLMGGEMSERGVVAFGKATASFRGRVRADISHRGGLFQRRAVRIGQKLAQSWPKSAAWTLKNGGTVERLRNGRSPALAQRVAAKLVSKCGVCFGQSRSKALLSLASSSNAAGAGERPRLMDSPEVALWAKSLRG